jgi:hypothetical protein
MKHKDNGHGEEEGKGVSREIFKQLAKQVYEGDAETMFAVGASMRAMMRYGKA